MRIRETLGDFGRRFRRLWERIRMDFHETLGDFGRGFVKIHKTLGDFGRGFAWIFVRLWERI